MTGIPMWRIKFVIITIIFIYVCVYILVNAGHLCVNVFRDDKRVAESLDLALQLFVSFWKWVLGTKLESCWKTGDNLNPWAIFQPLKKKKEWSKVNIYIYIFISLTILLF